MCACVGAEGQSAYPLQTRRRIPTIWAALGLCRQAYDDGGESTSFIEILYLHPSKIKSIASIVSLTLTFCDCDCFVRICLSACLSLSSLSLSLILTRSLTHLLALCFFVPRSYSKAWRAMSSLSRSFTTRASLVSPQRNHVGRNEVIPILELHSS